MPFFALSPPSSRPQAVAPRPLWRLPPPAFVASLQSSRPQALTRILREFAPAGLCCPHLLGPRH